MENEADPILPITLPTPDSRDCTDYSSEVKLSIKVIRITHIVSQTNVYPEINL
jgi:hypothetical protein